jgi:two-component system, OmpR family, phosphate regulon sensor histidine kinase PhoR
LKNNFIYDMTHDFKTPLSTISIANDFIKKSEGSENKIDIKKYSSIISEETLRLKSMINHILQITVIDEGSINIVFEKHNMVSIVNEVLNSYELIIKEKNGILKFETDMESIEVNCDKILISNVLSNLIDNAIKYTVLAPEILIKLERKNEMLSLSVIDNGIGIEKKDIRLIFNKLYRANTNDQKGFGIGLYYVKTIINAHNGKIEVDSTPGKGSNFNIQLPLFK